MKLEEKLQQLKKAAQASARDSELERQLEYLRRTEQLARKLPAKRVPHRIEEYVDGRVERNARGEYFVARQALPFGRPYGRLRVSDLYTAELSPLKLLTATREFPEPAEVVYLDTETTGLAGGTGTCAFLIGIGALEGSQFVIQQFFLRDFPEEKAVLTALAEALQRFKGIATFNGKAFDIPLLETRYALARLRSPFDRLLHFDALHPARGLWKLRLASCELTNLEQEVLGISREGDVPGSEIPAIYFDYLRTGNARQLQPVFYHNALDVVTLAALVAEMARVIGEAGDSASISSLDLFSLSRMFDRARITEKSVVTCQRALAGGLPEPVEARALWQLASQHKKQRQHQIAVEIWKELARREAEFAVRALEELAIYFEHRQRDLGLALEFTRTALERLRGESPASRRLRELTRRLERLERKAAQASV